MKNMSAIDSQGENGSSRTTSNLGAAQTAKKVAICCLKSVKPNLSSKWMIVALIILGIVGLGVVGVGVTGFFAQQHMLPAALAKLNALGALGHAGSITMMAGGGVLTLIAVGMLLAAVGMHLAENTQITNDVPESVPEHLRSIYAQLNSGEHTYIQNKDGSYTFIARLPSQYKTLEPGISTVSKEEFEETNKICESASTYKEIKE